MINGTVIRLAIGFFILLAAAEIKVPAGEPAGPMAGKKANGKMAAEFFLQGAIPKLVIVIKSPELRQLKRSSREYVPATVKEGDVVYEDVGVHLKGSAGSFRGLYDRPALTLNFNKYRKDQFFHGMDKIALNNSVQDPSLMTEIVCGELFLAAGIPAAQASHARVILNGEDLGLYVLKEGFDKAFLRRHFKDSSGNLYDGGFLRDITEPLQRNSGSGPLDHADLKKLAEAAQEPDATKRLARLEQVLDIDRFLTFMALETMTCHWDGYTMKHNNYRLYSDPESKKFVFLPHGMDQMFRDTSYSVMPSADGLVASAIMTTRQGRQRYFERFSLLASNVFRVEVLTNRIHEINTRIRPLLKEIDTQNSRFNDYTAKDLTLRIVERAEYIYREIAAIRAIKPVQFDASGFYAIKDWKSYESGNSTLGRTSMDGRQTYHIMIPAGNPCIASWRTSLHLEPGRYRFEAVARARFVEPVRDQRGDGAGIRISGEDSRRRNSLSGSTSWTQLTHEFTVPEDSDNPVVFICELRATKGEVWFDADSLRIAKL